MISYFQNISKEAEILNNNTNNIIKATDLPVFFLKPGEFFASKTPYKVKTLLGTCVSICLFDKSLRIGGINHFMLPEGKSDPELPAKYGDQAFKFLLEKLKKHGVKQSSLKAKVFGGADNTTGFARSSRIGERNVEKAIELLELEKIPVIAQNTGGNLGRKIFFYTGTGNVYMKFLTPDPSVL